MCARFKGRVTEISGKRITIDTSEETRVYRDAKGGKDRVVTSAWLAPEMPKVGAICRCNFHNRDRS